MDAMDATSERAGAFALVILSAAVLGAIAHACRQRARGTEVRQGARNIRDAAAATLHAERRLTRKMVSAGKVRICAYCDVSVPLEHTDMHLAGKRHKKLAGIDSRWRWVDAPPACPVVEESSSTEHAAAHTHKAEHGRSEHHGKWQCAGASRGRKAGGKKSSEAGERARAVQMAELDRLPTLGFKVLADGVEPILPLIRSGHKTIELRRKGSRLSDGSIMDRLRPGDRFVGVPLSSQMHYRCLIEVVGPIEHYESHGAAWDAHRERAVPRSLGPVRSAAEAQRFYERCFYDGKLLVDSPVLAIPVRAVIWRS